MIKQAHINPLFIDHAPQYAHLITREPQDKQTFINSIRTYYKIRTPKTALFIHAVKKSEFDTIRLSEDKSAILFNQ